MENKTKKNKYCHGCYNNIYNSQEKDCWHLGDSEIIWRKEVHIDQIPPYKQPYRRFLSCYRKQRYVYINKE